MSRTLGEGIIKLNENADERSVIDSIDRPIRPLVIEMMRVGFQTCFSCCGFTYEDEEEPKSHHEFTYVVFKGPHLEDFGEVQRFFALADLARKGGWQISLMTQNSTPEAQEWHIGFSPAHIPWQKNYDGKSLHEYEARVYAIQIMVNALKQWPSVKNSVEIVDGNVERANFATDWQVHPKKATVVHFGQ